MKNKKSKGSSALGMITIIVVLLLYLTMCSGGGSGSGRTMGKCWICGKSGSYQVDGSYYCHKHYNDRMFGRIG